MSNDKNQKSVIIKNRLAITNIFEGYFMKISSVLDAKFNEEYIIKSIDTENDEINKFLLSLGCFKGQVISLASIISDTYVISVKDTRFSIDKELAACIKI